MYRKVDERFIVESLIYTRFDVLIDILLKKASSLFDDRVDFVPIGSEIYLSFHIPMQGHPSTVSEIFVTNMYILFQIEPFMYIYFESIEIAKKSRCFD